MIVRLPIVLFFLVGVVGAHAAERQIDATPFAHAPCSVLRRGPCTPSYCSIFNHGPCIPEMNYPYGENLQLTVRSPPPEADSEKYKAPDRDLNTLGDLMAKLRSCWAPPEKDKARAGMQISVRFSFNRNGKIIGPPQMTYSTPGVPAETRAAYLDAINASLENCLPLKFTTGLGGAIAGRPIMVRYIDGRGENSSVTPGAQGSAPRNE